MFQVMHVNEEVATTVWLSQTSSLRGSCQSNLGAGKQPVVACHPIQRLGRDNGWGQSQLQTD